MRTAFDGAAPMNVALLLPMRTGWTTKLAQGGSSEVDVHGLGRLQIDNLKPEALG